MEMLRITDEENNDEKTDVDSTDIGLFFGYQFPMGFRILGTAFLSSEQDVETLDVDPDGSGGFKIELGVKAMRNVAIHLFYTNRKTERTVSNTTTEYDSQSYGLSVSFPFMY